MFDSACDFGSKSSDDSSRSTASYYSSVVKIYTYANKPNVTMPWQKLRQTTSTSSGFIISGNRIICNAHGVRYFSEVRVRKPNDPKKYVAKVLAIGHECDLALLTVTDQKFFVDVDALEFGAVPALQSEVIVVGYPEGGDNISVTKGVVSRVDVQRYSNTDEELLSIQIDASINNGNSGGPAMLNDKVVGVCFETLVEAENIGYIIPVPVIYHFLEDLHRNSEYTGFPFTEVTWQEIQNDSMRESLQMGDDQHGVLVVDLPAIPYEGGQLKKGDVIMAFDGVSIADDGTVRYRQGERVSFDYLFTNKFIGDAANFTVLRDGEVTQISDVVMRKRIDLVPWHLFDRTPAYYVYAGLVFVPLTECWLRGEFSREWTSEAPNSLCQLTNSTHHQAQKKDEEIIILSQVNVTEFTFGYEDMVDTQVKSLNGKPLRNLKALIDTIESSTDKFLRFQLGENCHIVLDREACNKATPQILEDNQIDKQWRLSKPLANHSTPHGEPLIDKSYMNEYLALIGSGSNSPRLTKSSIKTTPKFVESAESSVFEEHMKNDVESIACCVNKQGDGTSNASTEKTSQVEENFILITHTHGIIQGDGADTISTEKNNQVEQNSILITHGTIQGDGADTISNEKQNQVEIRV